MADPEPIDDVLDRLGNLQSITTALQSRADRFEGDRDAVLHRLEAIKDTINDLKEGCKRLKESCDKAKSDAEKFLEKKIRDRDVAEQGEIKKIIDDINSINKFGLTPISDAIEALEKEVKDLQDCLPAPEGGLPAGPRAPPPPGPPGPGVRRPGALKIIDPVTKEEVIGDKSSAQARAGGGRKTRKHKGGYTYGKT